MGKSPFGGGTPDRVGDEDYYEDDYTEEEGFAKFDTEFWEGNSGAEWMSMEADGLKEAYLFMKKLPLECKREIYGEGGQAHSFMTPAMLRISPIAGPSGIDADAVGGEEKVMNKELEFWVQAVERPWMRMTRVNGHRITEHYRPAETGGKFECEVETDMAGSTEVISFCKHWGVMDIKFAVREMKGIELHEQFITVRWLDKEEREAKMNQLEEEARTDIKEKMSASMSRCVRIQWRKPASCDNDNMWDQAPGGTDKGVDVCILIYE